MILNSNVLHQCLCLSVCVCVRVMYMNKVFAVCCERLAIINIWLLAARDKSPVKH